MSWRAQQMHQHTSSHAPHGPPSNRQTPSFTRPHTYEPPLNLRPPIKHTPSHQQRQLRPTSLLGWFGWRASSVWTSGGAEGSHLMGTGEVLCGPSWSSQPQQEPRLRQHHRQHCKRRRGWFAAGGGAGVAVAVGAQRVGGGLEEVRGVGLAGMLETVVVAVVVLVAAAACGPERVFGKLCEPT
eukprot:1157844-Pelagomonas_calceolata.AAC.2